MQAIIAAEIKQRKVTGKPDLEIPTETDEEW